MKANKEHRVPLSSQALELLRTQPRTPMVDHVFPSNRRGPLSDMAFTALMRRHALGAVPHGFRSTFRDWAVEMTHHPRDAVELCLAHAIDNKTEAAYRRGDMLEKAGCRDAGLGWVCSFNGAPASKGSTMRGDCPHCRSVARPHSVLDKGLYWMDVICW